MVGLAAVRPITLPIWLGEAYNDYSIWITVAGLVVLVALIALITRWVRREAER